NLLSDENLKRYEEAEASYRKAIELNPSDATAYSNLGNLLSDENLKRYEEAEASYRKAIELNPSDATAYSNLGLLLHENLKRYEEAEASYRKAIELNPSDATAYSNLGILLRVIGREREAIPLLEKVIEIAPKDFNPYLGIASISKSIGEPIPDQFVEKARQLIPEDDLYNRACLESVCDNVDLAFEYLMQAVKKEKLNPAWAWQDPDLQWIRDDPRFAEIVGKKPEK
ncbi:MAG: tetratricopeptide repeat protein, partial [Chloroflexi bacterium]|nr:tetratricopeptide repeat protein [Chloroflexota bacterium]